MPTYTQNFDGSGSVPAGWTWDAAFSVTSTPGGGISPVSGANVLKLAATASTAEKYGTYGTQDANGGDVTVSCDFNAQNTSGPQSFGVYARGNNSDLSLAGKFYKARLNTGSNSLDLIRAVSGSPTTLATISPGLGSGTWYKVTLSAAGSSTTTLTITVQDLGTGHYLNSSGSFVAGPAIAITYADSTGAVTGAGYVGLSIVSKLDNAYADDFSLDNASAAASATIAKTEGHDTASVSGSFRSSATIARTEGRDAGAIVGVSTRGAIAATERRDTASIAGSNATGSIAATERRDVGSIGGNTPNAILTRLEGADTPAISGDFTSAATMAAVETPDAAVLLAASPGAGRLAAVERGDVAAISASSQASATISATEGRDAASIVGVVAVHSALAIAEAGDRAAIYAVAAGIPPYFKVQEQPDVAVILGGAPTTWYLVYANLGDSGPINYDTPIAETTATTWMSGALATPGTWKFGVRAENTAGIEQNLDCQVSIVFDANSNDITNVPAPPVGLRAFAKANGNIKVEWTYSPVTIPAKRPTQFLVYAGTGGTPDYSAPVATIPAGSAIMNVYATTLTGLVDGTTYAIGCRAANATGTEANTTTVSATSDAVGPLPVQSLVATAIV